MGILHHYQINRMACYIFLVFLVNILKIKGEKLNFLPRCRWRGGGVLSIWTPSLYNVFFFTEESESFQKFEDDLKEYLEHEFKLEDEDTDDDDVDTFGLPLAPQKAAPSRIKEAPTRKSLDDDDDDVDTFDLAPLRKNVVPPKASKKKSLDEFRLEDDDDDDVDTFDLAPPRRNVLPPKAASSRMKDAPPKRSLEDVRTEDEQNSEWESERFV